MNSKKKFVFSIDLEPLDSSEISTANFVLFCSLLSSQAFAEPSGNLQTGKNNKFMLVLSVEVFVIHITKAH